MCVHMGGIYLVLIFRLDLIEKQEQQQKNIKTKQTKKTPNKSKPKQGDGCKCISEIMPEPAAPFNKI